MMLSCRSNSRCLCLVSEVSLFYDICCELQVAPVVKNLPASVGDVRNTGLIPGSGRTPGGGNGNPLHYFALRTPWTEEPGRL